MTINPRPKWGKSPGRKIPELVLAGGGCAGGVLSTLTTWTDWGMPSTTFFVPKWANRARIAVTVSVHIAAGPTYGLLRLLKNDVTGSPLASADWAGPDPGGGYSVAILVDDDHAVEGGESFTLKTQHYIGSGVGSSNSDFARYQCLVWWERS